MQAQKLYQVVIDTLSDGIFMVDVDRNIMVWNDSAQRITGYTFEEIASHNCIAELLNIMSVSITTSCSECMIHSVLKDGRKRIRELVITHKRGHKVPVVVKSMPVYSGEDIVGAMAVFTDNNNQLQEKALFDSLVKQATTDPLTGLPNRRHIEMALQERLHTTQQHGGHLCVMFINLDDFSQCNKQYDRDTGDDLLVHLASRFKASLRDTDLIGRWTGEEFLGVFLAQSPDHLRVLAKKIKDLIAASQIHIAEDLVGVTASIGATLAHSGDSPKQLINRATALMHVSKISGKNCVTIG